MVSDLYADGLDRVETLKNGNLRFVFYRETPNGRQDLRRSIVMAACAVPDAILKSSMAAAVDVMGAPKPALH